jgi:Sensors of blue-light using FAD
MTTLAQVAYCSSAVHLLSDPELDRLLVGARGFNATVGVTGALLHHDGSFFQYFEGPKEGVDEVYARIKSSKLHKGLLQLLSGPTDTLHLTAWHMGFAQVPHSAVQILAQADWLRSRDSLKNIASGQPIAPGLRLLLQFWQSAMRETG